MVQDAIDAVVSSVVSQTSAYTVPVHDVHLPMQGDFNRIQFIIDEIAWLALPASRWPEKFRRRMQVLPLSLVPSLCRDVTKMLKGLETSIMRYDAMKASFQQWIIDVCAEKDARRM